MKTIKATIILTLVSIFTTTTYAAEVPRESAPCNASDEVIVVVESLIGDVLDSITGSMPVLQWMNLRRSFFTVLCTITKKECLKTSHIQKI